MLDDEGIVADGGAEDRHDVRVAWEPHQQLELSDCRLRLGLCLKGRNDLQRDAHRRRVVWRRFEHTFADLVTYVSRSSIRPLQEWGV